MEVAANVQALWRYPVSSLRGERVDALTVAIDGVRGDRGHLLVDLVSGEIAAPEKIVRWRPALELGARIFDGDVMIPWPRRRRLESHRARRLRAPNARQRSPDQLVHLIGEMVRVEDFSAGHPLRCALLRTF
ncbi:MULTISPECIES: MOSC N-terminal beta barrel domain-containing protein [unclassified Rhizobium]